MANNYSTKQQKYFVNVQDSQQIDYIASSGGYINIIIKKKEVNYNTKQKKKKRKKRRI